MLRSPASAHGDKGILMGVLDELKQQAALLKQDSGGATRLRNLQAMQPGLKEARRYLSELADTLNITKPAVYRSYYVDMAKRLEKLAQCEYMVRQKQRTIDNKDYLEEVAFRFRCVGTGNLNIEKTSAEGVKRLQEYLWTYNMRFECRELKSERDRLERRMFTIFSEVPAAATLVGDWNTGKIKLALKNIERPGEVLYQYDFVEINSELLDEFAKVLLDRPNRFREFGSHQQMMRSTPRRRGNA
jgi:hypothetical protein